MSGCNSHTAKIFTKTKLRKLVLQLLARHGMTLSSAIVLAKKRLADDPEWQQLTTNLKVGVEHMRGKNPASRWYAIAIMEYGERNVKRFQVREFPHGDPKKARGFTEVRGPFATRAKAIAAKEKLKKAELKWKKSKTYQQRKKKYGLADYEVNPHLTSGKWRFVGMFDKRDVKQVKKILRVHGMKTKFTGDQLKKGSGCKELYVERGAFDTAYRAISRLFVSEKSMRAA